MEVELVAIDDSMVWTRHFWQHRVYMCLKIQYIKTTRVRYYLQKMVKSPVAERPNTSMYDISS